MPPPCLIVTGMHRSGTSFAASLLGKGGLFVGNETGGPAFDNPYGFFEDAEFVEIHRQALIALGHGSQGFVRSGGLRMPEASRKAAESLVAARRSANQPWGWKDPRATLFLRDWERMLPEAHFIILFRSPWDVVDSLLRRGDAAVREFPSLAIGIWSNYNTLLLEACDRLGDRAMLVESSHVAADPAGFVARAAARAGAHLKPPPDGVFDEEAMGRLDPAPFVALLSDVAPDALRTYAQLRERSGLPPVGDSGGDGDVRHPLDRAMALWGALRAQDSRTARFVQSPADAQLAQEAADLRTRVESVTDELRAAYGQRDHLQSELDRKFAELQSRTEELVSVQSQLVGLSDDLVLQQAACTENRLRSESQRAEIDRLHACMLAMQARAEQLGATAGRLEQRCESLEEQLQRLEAELVDTQQHAAMERADLKHALEAQVATVVAERDAMTVHRDALVADRDALHAAHDALQAELAGAHLSAAQLSARIQELEALVQAASLREQHAYDTLARAQAQVQLLQGEIGSMRASKSWRATEPLRAASRAIIETRRALRRKARLVATDSVPPARPGLPDVLVWSVIDWDFRIQRPQHMARELAAAGHRVFYISNNLIDHPEPGSSVEPLPGPSGLYRVQLHAKGAPQIYFAGPSADVQRQLLGSLGDLARRMDIRTAVSVVQHPFWTATAESVPGARVVYDCMDHHEGFGNNASDILGLEARLIADSDLVVVTSGWLYERLAAKTRACALVRNAAEYSRFSAAPDVPYRDRSGRKVIGYYGAVAEWFDVELVERVAAAHADCEVLIVGADTVGAAARLSQCANVRFTGEVPYDRLTHYLYGFDVCMLPFRVIDLTLATNPVKVYEYLSAGKHVVSVDLPELKQMEGLIAVAPDADEFVAAVGKALAQPPTRSEIAARREFASSQTWSHRAAELDRALRDAPEPHVTIVVVTYNNLEFTKACLLSLERHADYRECDVIVVDNASSDGTPEFLAAWAAAAPGRTVIANSENTGFAAANNQGVRAAAGEYVVLLNNDTFVTDGWIRTMLRHLRRDSRLGMVGPVTNNIGNEAKIDINYANMEEMAVACREHTTRHLGEAMRIPVLAFFCVMIQRDLYLRIGGLDEGYGRGFFEDDDFCKRLGQEGLDVACAEDVFVHHHLSASFEKVSTQERKTLFERNKARFEERWGPWIPHRYRS
jgi:GT2 family glycosyltransferase/glycosyltransferase involved in cell wall biosynthesis